MPAARRLAPRPGLGPSIARSAMAAALAVWLPAAHAHMTAEAYGAARAQLGPAEQAALARCPAADAGVQRLCETEASASARVARAALAYRRSTRARDGIKLLTTQAHAAHAVARQKCVSADDRSACDADAAAVQRGALKAAQARWASGQADADAARDARRFDYDDAVARCNDHAGDSKAHCLWSAAWQFDQPPPAGAGPNPARP